MLMVAPNGAKVKAADYAVENLKKLGFKPVVEKAVEEKPKAKRKAE
ncbi:MAG: hypothetical protein IJ113_09580 [Eggerthellaceae bacterium]|nr:hypothetical protein [Eggerthellaceae bacterium]